MRFTADGQDLRQIPVEHCVDAGGIDFHEQELLEFSIVSVPANSEALLELSAAHKVHARRRQRYGHVYAHRYYVRRGYVRPRGGGLFGCRHWSPVGVYWTCYFW